MKYRPDFPDRFGGPEDSHAFCQRFFPWYNDDHRHSGIGMLTPAMVRPRSGNPRKAPDLPGSPGPFRPQTPYSPAAPPGGLDQQTTNLRQITH